MTLATNKVYKAFIYLLTIFIIVLFCHNQQNTHFQLDAQKYFITANNQATKTPAINLLALPITKIYPLHHNRTYILPEPNYNGPLFQLIWHKTIMSNSEEASAKKWFFVSFFGYLIGILLILRAFKINTIYTFALMLLYTLAAPATIYNLASGQVGGICAFVVGVLCYLSSQNQQKLFAAFLGFAVCFKYFFVILAANILHNKKLISIAVITFILCLYLPTLFLDQAALIKHFHLFYGNALASIILKGYNTLNSGIFAGIVRPWTDSFGPQYSPIWQLILVFFLSSLAFFATSLSSLNRKDKSSSTSYFLTQLKNLAAFLILANLINPLSWSYYDFCYLPGIIIILISLNNRKNKNIYIIALVSIIFCKHWKYFNYINFASLAHNHNSIYLYGFASLKNFWINYAHILANISLLPLTLTANLQHINPKSLTIPFTAYILCLIPLFAWIPDWGMQF